MRKRFPGGRRTAAQHDAAAWPRGTGSRTGASTSSSATASFATNEVRNRGRARFGSLDNFFVHLGPLAARVLAATPTPDAARPPPGDVPFR
ncbi:hypothetical protein WJ04_09470 [Burkholderia vietnamiensis]|nr:hypothetical protein WJ04_09470 [Burkholderia vietnamiensis]